MFQSTSYSLIGMQPLYKDGVILSFFVTNECFLSVSGNVNTSAAVSTSSMCHWHGQSTCSSNL